MGFFPSFSADSMEAPLIHGSLPSTCFILMIFQDTGSPLIQRLPQHTLSRPSANNFSFMPKDSSQDSCLAGRNKKEKRERERRGERVRGGRNPVKEDLSSTPRVRRCFFLSIARRQQGSISVCKVGIASCCRSGAVHYPCRSLYKYVPFVAFDAAVIERTARV